MQLVISGTVYGHPYIKKNSQRTIMHRTLKRPIVVYNPKYTAWANDAKKQMLSHKYKLGIDYPVILKVTFYCKTQRERDLSNSYEGIQDVMVTVGLLKDDNFKIVAGHDGSRIKCDKEHPRIEWEIHKLEEFEL